MNKNKISFFIPSLRGGGAERVFVNLANEFANNGFDVDLVLSQKEGPYLINVSKKVRIVDLKSKRVLFSLIPLIFYLRKEKPSYLFSTLTHANIVAIIAKKISMVDLKLIIRQEIYFSSIPSRKLKLIAQFFYKKANSIIALSKDMADDLINNIDIDKNNIVVINNPVIKKLKEEFSDNINHPFFENKENKIILGIGRLSDQKDFYSLIKAFDQIRKNNNIKLIILGDGEERKNLEELIKILNLEDHVDMPGFVDNPYRYMSNANLFVLSSKYEGFPNVLIEAMACGLPVVSTDCLSGPREILDSGKYGTLVPVGDVDALAKAIEEALKKPTESRKLIERSNDFDIKKIFNEYLKLL